MFYDVFKQLCCTKGVSPSRACLDMNLSRSLGAKWKNTGANPSFEVLSKMAKYFNVSVDYLLGNEQKEKPIDNDFGGLQGVYLNFAKEAQKNDIDPDDIRLALDTIKRLKDK